MDTATITALLERYERPLVRYALGIVGELEAARDAVQETFIRLARDGGPKDNDPKHIEAWLFTAVRHRSIDYQRKFSRMVPLEIPEDRPDASPTPDRALAERDDEDELFSLLDSLSANQREVIRLRFQNDLSYQEIAAVTGLTTTNVGFLLHTGLKKLRAMLEGRTAHLTTQPTPALAAT